MHILLIEDKESLLSGIGLDLQVGKELIVQIILIDYHYHFL